MTNDFAPEIPETYPRPQAFRPDYMLLDGEWDLNGRPIRVPFPPEAPMSGFEGKAGAVLHYEKDFTVPEAWRGKRILLHFGAVDQIAKVTLNDTYLGKHTGGYLGFTFDITEHVRFADDGTAGGMTTAVAEKETADAMTTDAPGAITAAKESLEKEETGQSGKNATYENVKRISGKASEDRTDLNNLVVTAIDSNDPTIPYGKQSKDPQGMWYTGISGIWKSVWLEAVPETYIEKIKLEPDQTGVNIRLYLNSQVSAAAPEKAKSSNTQGEDISHKSEKQGFRAVIVGEGIYPEGFREQLGSGETFHFSGDRGRLEPMDPVLWSPDNPHLYRLRIDCGEDTVYTYFGLRTIGMKQFGERKRPVLNGKAVFLNGVLDQGYFPEGIFVPGTMTAYDRDILAMKELGFNAVVEAALGADLVAYSEAKELTEKGFLTSSCCPAFVAYIRTAFPELEEHISHNLSPMAEIARYIKGVEPASRVVFIGPCTAKKAEVKLKTVKPYVDAVLTFEELQALFDSRDIDITTLDEDVPEDASYFGRIFARSGGLSDAVAEALKEQGLDSFDLSACTCSGIEACRTALMKKKRNVLAENFIEGMACEGGCIGGAGCLTHAERNRAQVDAYCKDAADKKISDAIAGLRI